MLDAHVVVFHGLGLTGGGAQHLVGGLRDIHLVGVTARAGHTGHTGKLFGHGSREAARVNVQFLQKLRDKALLLRCQSVEQMLRLQRVMLILHSQLLCCLQSFKGLLSILIGIHKVDLHSYRKLIFSDELKGFFNTL